MAIEDDNKREQSEIQKQFKQQQEKYTYYIIALCVAAIGFAITKTSGQGLKLIQIPLGLAVLSWGISIYCGLTFISYTISTLFTNNMYYDIILGIHPKTGTHPEKIRVGVEAVTEAMDVNIKTASAYAKWQTKLFYWGMILFVTWHILEMYMQPVQLKA